MCVGSKGTKGSLTAFHGRANESSPFRAVKPKQDEKRLARSSEENWYDVETKPMNLFMSLGELVFCGQLQDLDLVQSP